MRDNKPRRKGLAARNRALFFCVLTLTLGVLGSFFMTSCNTPAGRPERDTLSESPQAPSESDTERGTSDSSANPESIQPKSETVDERGFYPDTGVALKKLRAENEALREENGRLHIEVMKLNEELAEAAAEIYSLNRKLDAIFKPEPGGN